jgi:outer membrane receptor protein involved in Fe transport
MLFALHYTDRIASVLTGEVTPSGRNIVQSQNVAAADIYGIEISMHFEMTMALAADLIVNIQRGEQAEPDGAQVPADRMPPLNGRFGLVYQATNDFRIVSYLVFAAGQDRLSPRDVQDARINPAGTPGWVTANISAAWRANDRWHFRAAFENLLDKQYRVHGSGIDAVGLNFVVSADLRW